MKITKIKFLLCLATLSASALSLQSYASFPFMNAAVASFAGTWTGQLVSKAKTQGAINTQCSCKMKMVIGGGRNVTFTLSSPVVQAGAPAFCSQLSSLCNGQPIQNPMLKIPFGHNSFTLSLDPNHMDAAGNLTYTFWLKPGKNILVAHKGIFLQGFSGEAGTEIKLTKH